VRERNRTPPTSRRLRATSRRTQCVAPSRSRPRAGTQTNRELPRRSRVTSRRTEVRRTRYVAAECSDAGKPAVHALHALLSRTVVGHVLLSRERVRGRMKRAAPARTSPKAALSLSPFIVVKGRSARAPPLAPSPRPPKSAFALPSPLAPSPRPPKPAFAVPVPLPSPLAPSPRPPKPAFALSVPVPSPRRTKFPPPKPAFASCRVPDPTPPASPCRCSCLIRHCPPSRLRPSSPRCR
jgi:hypothetical protein